jgi:hypothetical protein
MIFITGPTMINTSSIKYTTQRASNIPHIFAIAFSAKKLVKYCAIFEGSSGICSGILSSIFFSVTTGITIFSCFSSVCERAVCT